MLLLGDNLIKAAFGWGFLIITYFIIHLCSSSKWGFSLYKLLRPSNVTTQTHVLRNFNPTYLVKSFYYTQRPWSLKNSFLCAWKFDWTKSALNWQKDQCVSLFEKKHRKFVFFIQNLWAFNFLDNYICFLKFSNLIVLFKRFLYALHVILQWFWCVN